MCYQVMFAWQRQPKQETLSHMTSKTESIKWAVQLLKTNFTFIRPGYLCSRHEVCQPHFSLTRFSTASRILMNRHCNMYERWHWDVFMKNQVPMKYEQLLAGFSTYLAHLKCPFQRPCLSGVHLQVYAQIFIIFNQFKNQRSYSQSNSSVNSSLMGAEPRLVRA